MSNFPREDVLGIRFVEDETANEKINKIATKLLPELNKEDLDAVVQSVVTEYYSQITAMIGEGDKDVFAEETNKVNEFTGENDKFVAMNRQYHGSYDF